MIESHLQYKQPIMLSEHGSNYMTVKDFIMMATEGKLKDYTGVGRPAKGGLGSDMLIYPSEWGTIPSDATHIVWYPKKVDYGIENGMSG